MASEALEAIVGTAPTFERTGMCTTIDVYAAGTAALYWGPSWEEEEMHMMEEQRRMESKMEIESAITAQYSDAPQAPQWSLDQPSYGSEITYSVHSNIEAPEPPEWHGNGCSFTTYIEPEPVTSMEELNNWKSSQIPEPEPTIHSLHIDGVDYSQLINSLPEPTRLSSPGGMGWGFEMKLEPPIAPIDPLQGIGHMDKPDTGFNPFRSSLEDTYYGSSEKPYIPTTRPTWDTDLMPKPEPVDYTSPVSNIMNRIGMPELDLKLKSYLLPSPNYLRGMGFSEGSSPDTSFRSAPSSLAEMEADRRLKKMKRPRTILQYQDPTQTTLDLMEKTRHGSTVGLDSEPKSYLTALRHQLGINSLPEPEPDSPFSIPELDLKPKSYLPPSLRHLQDMYPVPEPAPEDMSSVMDLMKDRFTVPKFDFSEYMNTVPEPEPVIPVRPVFEIIDLGLPSIEDLKPKHVLPNIDETFPSYGNYALGLQSLEHEIPELKDYDITERYDLSGHKTGKKGPHVGYDFRATEDDDSEKLFKLPFFSEAGKKKDSIGLSEFGIGKDIIDKWKKSLKDE